MDRRPAQCIECDQTPFASSRRWMLMAGGGFFFPLFLSCTFRTSGRYIEGHRKMGWGRIKPIEVFDCGTVVTSDTPQASAGESTFVWGQRAGVGNSGSLGRSGLRTKVSQVHVRQHSSDHLRPGGCSRGIRASTLSLTLNQSLTLFVKSILAVARCMVCDVIYRHRGGSLGSMLCKRERE